MSKLLHDFEEFLQNRTHKLFCDFDHIITADMFTITASNSGEAVVQEAAGGILKIDPSSDGGNSQVVDDETYVESTHELFKLATDKPLLFAARVRPYANTIGTLSLYVGLMDDVAANCIQDTTGLPKTPVNHLGFYNKAAGTTWYCEAAANSAEDARVAGLSNGVSSGKTVGNNAWDILVIETKPLSSTQTEVHFFMADEQTDGSYSLQEVGLVTPDGSQQFVAQVVTHTSAAEMAVCLGVKAGTANNSQYLDVDWVYAAQKR